MVTRGAFGFGVLGLGIGVASLRSVLSPGDMHSFIHSQAYLEMSKGLFGWAVALKKVAVGCELWKKLL
jgi:hypothetical protein